jgi:hypothetical protein
MPLRLSLKEDIAFRFAPFFKLMQEFERSRAAADLRVHREYPPFKVGVREPRIIEKSRFVKRRSAEVIETAMGAEIP